MKKIFFSSLTFVISFLFIGIHTASAQGPTPTPTPGGGTFTLTVQAIIPNTTGGTVPAVKGKTILVRTTFNAQKQWPAISNPMQMQISLKTSSNGVVASTTSTSLFQGGNDTPFTIPATIPAGTGYYIEVKGLQTVENGATRVNPTAKTAPFSIVDAAATPTLTPTRTPTPTQGAGGLPDLQLDSIRTDQQSSTVIVRLCNRGGSTIPEGKNFSSSVTNPTTGASSVSPNYTQAIPVNSCVEQSIPCATIPCNATNATIVIDRLNQVAEANETDNTRTGVNLQNTISIAPPNCVLQPRGDADCNGAFQSEDYTIWSKFFLGLDYPNKLPYHKADFNNDGKVSVTDAEIWRMSFYGPAPTIVASTITIPQVSVTGTVPTAVVITPTVTKTPTPVASVTPSRTPTPSRAPTPTAGPTFLSSFTTTGSGVGIDVDTSGNIYVTDVTAGIVRKFSSAGQQLLTIGTKGTGNGQFQYPFDVAVNPLNNNIAVSDLSAPNKVQLFNSSGTFIQTLASPNTINSAQGIDYDKSNGDLYIVDSNRAVVHRLSSTGAWSMIGATAGVEQKLVSPSAVSASAGRVAVMEDDGIGPRVKLYQSNGTYIKMFNNGQFQRNSFVEMDSFAYIYVSDTTSRKIWKYDANGNFIWSYSSPASGNGSIGNPADIALGGPTNPANGFQNIFVVDSQTKQVVIFKQ